MKNSFLPSALTAFIITVYSALPVFADFTVSLTHGTNKHRPEFSFEPVTEYQIYAAQNEWEPFQVLIRSEQGLIGVNITVGPFSGPGEPITGIEPYRVHYVPVTLDTISQKPSDPSRAGDWPDALVPFVDHFVGEARSGAPFDVVPDFSQAVFVDVYIPEDQEPGNYTSVVTVTAESRPAWTGAVTLTVWDFRLPNALSIDSNYGFSQLVATSYHARHGGVTPADTLLDRYYLEFARHRMGLYNWARGGPTYSWNDATGTFDWDWTEYDANQSPFLDGTFYKPGFEFTGVRLWWAPGSRPEHVPLDLWEREWFAGWADHFRERGWFDHLWYYLPDEPSPEQYPYLAELADRIHAGDTELTVMVTEQIVPELTGHVNLWCPDEPLFSDSRPWPPFPRDYDERRAAGDKTWWYNCVGATVGRGWSNHMVDYPSTQLRIWLWLTRRYHFEGVLFWFTMYQYMFADPWETQYIEQYSCQGDGTLIYPGTIDRIGGVTDIPVASLRMKYLREAMEDYEYFHILDERGENRWVDDVTITVAPLTWQWEQDWDVLLEWRHKLARKILGTLDEIPPEPPTDLISEASTSAIRVYFTPPADNDLAGYDAWYAVYEGDRIYGARAGPEAKALVVDGLAPGREYAIWLNSFDEEGNRSKDSETVHDTPRTAGDDDEPNDDTVGDDESEIEDNDDDACCGRD